MFAVRGIAVDGQNGWDLGGPGGERAVISGLGGRVCRLDLGPGFQGLIRPCQSAYPGSGHDKAGLGLDPWFSGCLLFPFNDRIPGGRYRFAGQTHQLAINSPDDGSAIHGFLYRRQMECHGLGSDDSGAWLELGARIRADDEPGFPFELDISVRYELAASGLRLGFAVVNTGLIEAPFTLGWHPYFSLGGAVEPWCLRMNSPAYVPVGPDLLPLGNAQPGGPALTAPVGGTMLDFRQARALGSQALDLAMVMPPDAKLILSDAGRKMEMSVGGLDSDWGYFQVFVPPDRQSIALEPVTAATNAFNQAEYGLKVLPPGDEWHGSVRIGVGGI